MGILNRIKGIFKRDRVRKNVQNNVPILSRRQRRLHARKLNKLKRMLVSGKYNDDPLFWQKVKALNMQKAEEMSLHEKKLKRCRYLQRKIVRMRNGIKREKMVLELHNLRKEINR